MKQRYQVAYEGQIITGPLDFNEAHAIAADENLDAFRKGHFPVCEVVLAKPSRFHELLNTLAGYPETLSNSQYLTLCQEKGIFLSTQAMDSLLAIVRSNPDIFGAFPPDFIPPFFKIHAWWLLYLVEVWEAMVSEELSFAELDVSTPDVRAFVRRVEATGERMKTWAPKPRPGRRPFRQDLVETNPRSLR